MVRRQQFSARQQRLVHEASSRLWRLTEGRIASGPFQGLQYVPRAIGSAWAPKLLGTYELELQSVIETIVARAYSRVVDIGAAEGYYAVGIGSRIPSVSVVSFELREAEHSLQRRFAEANGVAGRIQIYGGCSPDLLMRSLQPEERALVICDVEGAEYELLDPLGVPELAKADILVELHPWHHQDIASALRDRFRLTHEIEEIHTRLRRDADCPPTVSLPASQARACMDEDRPGPMSWFWMSACSRVGR